MYSTNITEKRSIKYANSKPKRNLTYFSINERLYNTLNIGTEYLLYFNF